MATILCLAHYCDTHGPQSVLTTEGINSGCASCFEEDTPSTRRPSSSRSLNPAESLAAIARGVKRANSTSSETGNGDSQTLSSPFPSPSPSAIETPPESPRVAALQSGHQRRDSSFRKTYDENDKKRATACEACALTLPKQTNGGADALDNNGPILRTRKAYERVSVAVEQPSPPRTDSCPSSDSDNAISSKPSNRRTRTPTLVRAGTSSSNSSFRSTLSHDHFLDYTSTHEPLAPQSFSIIRQSCLRTLSCETLPPSSMQTTAVPSSPFLNSSFASSIHTSSTTSTSGGPIFFGDPLAGYTTAYIFRIPDPNARGRRRVYALMALSTHRERAAMQAFAFLSTAFRDIACWIQGLAETELERAESINSPRMSTSEERAAVSTQSTPTSSFLSGRRQDSGKFAGMSLRARGLAELVGMPDFFLELHTVFVKLLIELHAKLGV